MPRSKSRGRRIAKSRSKSRGRKIPKSRSKRLTRLQGGTAANGESVSRASQGQPSAPSEIDWLNILETEEGPGAIVEAYLLPPEALQYPKYKVEYKAYASRLPLGRYTAEQRRTLQPLYSKLRLKELEGIDLNAEAQRSTFTAEVVNTLVSLSDGTVRYMIQLAQAAPESVQLEEAQTFRTMLSGGDATYFQPVTSLQNIDVRRLYLLSILLIKVIRGYIALTNSDTLKLSMMLYKVFLSRVRLQELADKILQALIGRDKNLYTTTPEEDAQRSVLDSIQNADERSQAVAALQDQYDARIQRLATPLFAEIASKIARGDLKAENLGYRI